MKQGSFSNCPACSERMQCVYTRPRPTSRTRIYRCPKCGHTVKTRETIVPPKNKPSIFLPVRKNT